MADEVTNNDDAERDHEEYLEYVASKYPTDYQRETENEREERLNWRMK